MKTLKKPRVFAHRGFMGEYPENTLLSFEKALEKNIYGIELDVLKCASGEIVVCHDDTVDRTTNGNGAVNELTYTELLKLDAGCGQKIPLLTDVLDLIDKRVVINIELKEFGIFEEVFNIVDFYIKNKGWKTEDFIFSSFNHHDLYNLKNSFMPDAILGALIEGIPIDYSSFAEKINARSINVFKETVTKNFVEDAHSKGLFVYCYTLNEEEEIKKLLELGIDGYFTNYP